MLGSGLVPASSTKASVPSGGRPSAVTGARPISMPLRNTTRVRSVVPSNTVSGPCGDRSGNHSTASEPATLARAIPVAGSTGVKKPGVTTVGGNAPDATTTTVPAEVTSKSFSANARGKRTQPCDAG